MCKDCSRRAFCRAPCARLAAELKAVTGKSHRGERLVSPEFIQIIFGRRTVVTLAELQPSGLDEQAEHLLAGLTPGQREALLLLLAESLSERQIAGRLGLSKTAVHKRLAAGRLRLRQCFNRPAGAGERNANHGKHDR